VARTTASTASLERSGGVKVPLLDRRLHAPDKGSLAWYAGLGAMTALEVIEWPIALVVGTSHALATHARNRELREFAGGSEAAA
jgi:hypothetical protein